MAAIFFTPAAAFADTAEDKSLITVDAASMTVTIGGHKYGPKDGVEVTTESYVVNSGGGTVGNEWFETPADGSNIPMATWGGSYAYSTEYAYLLYRGVGKAAANVYGGQRIIQVCFWWERSGSAVTGTTCSNATTGATSWIAGPEVVGWATDSPGWFDPPTIFHIQTTRISPNII